MLFYTIGNTRGDKMFQAAAETRKHDIESSNYFDSSNDLVILSSVQDLAKIKILVSNVVDTYSNLWGKTSEFSIWSHAGVDGPTGTISTSSHALYDKQLSIEGWGSIDFNWERGSIANFFGCKTGVGNSDTPSFITRLSAQPNFRDVMIHGQTSSAYPSSYTNVRLNTREMMNDKFSYPTYMVGGERLGFSGNLFPTFTTANPMRSSINGTGEVEDYYQEGRKYK